LLGAFIKWAGIAAVLFLLAACCLEFERFPSSSIFYFLVAGGCVAANTVC
jgi:hypothetical protein